MPNAHTPRVPLQSELRADEVTTTPASRPMTTPTLMPRMPTPGLSPYHAPSLSTVTAPASRNVVTPVVSPRERYRGAINHMQRYDSCAPAVETAVPSARTRYMIIDRAYIRGLRELVESSLDTLVEQISSSSIELGEEVSALCFF